MKTRVIVQFAPAHWAPNHQLHNPKRCLLCRLERIGYRLGVIVFEGYEND